MAVLQMEHITLCAMKRDRKKILELVQRRGVVEVENLVLLEEEFSNADTAALCNQFKKHAETAERAAELVAHYTENTRGGLSFLKGRTALTCGECDGFYEQSDEVLHKANRVLKLERDLAEAKADIARAEAQQEALAPWVDLPVPQTFNETKKTWVYIGSFEGDCTLEDILTKLAETGKETGPLHLEIISKAGSQTNVLLVALKTYAARTEEALRAIGFARPPGASRHLPKARVAHLDDVKAKAQKVIDEAEGELKDSGPLQEEFYLLQDHSKMRCEKYAAINKISQSKHTFILRGWVPQRAAQPLVDELHKNFDCDAVIEPALDWEDPPVILQNNRFSQPVEGVLESYSLPGKGEIDPTSVMSIFYYFMFGMMFSDAGYGLIMAGICGFCLLKFKNMDFNWKKNIRMFFWCGVSTIFWGVMFSSYFGDAIAVVSTQFFGKTVIVPPLWFDPLADPMRLLMFCMLIGLIHLSVGYILKGVQCWQNGDKPAVLFDSAFPLVIIYPLVTILMGTTMFEGLAGFRLTYPAFVNPVCFAVAGACMLGIVLTGGRESKNWGKRILKGLFALYNTLAGWLSDVLSYSRLLALGLATGVIASVMNSLGAMGSGMGWFLGLIMFIVVFCVGQALNFGINVLGAYVHSNRLEFVEFFGKFYDGGGHKFAPLGVHTKYYKIEEESQNV